MKPNYIWIWSCCDCRDITGHYRSSGMTTKIDFCPECSHPRCQRCVVKQWTRSSTRTSSQNSFELRSAIAPQTSSIAQSSSPLAAQISSLKLEDNHQETPDNKDSSTLANDNLKEATRKDSSTMLDPDASISKSAETSGTLISAEPAEPSLRDVSGKSLGKTSYPTDNALATEQSVAGIPMVIEAHNIHLNEDTLPLAHTSKSDVVDTFPRAFSPLDYFAEDPISYFNDISTLSRRVLNLHTATLLKIETKKGLSVLPLPEDSVSYLETSAMDHAWLQMSITENINIASAIRAGTELLADEGFCEFGYNIIVVDADRPKVLKILPVSMPSLAMLCDLLHELVSELEMGSLNISDVMHDVLELLLHIISTLGLEKSLGGGLLDAPRDSWPNICKLLSSTLSILHLALLTFIRSHLDVTNFPPNGLLSSALQIETLSGKVVMAPRRLNCLNRFIQRPVWAFSSHPQDIDSSRVEFDGFYVSTCAEDFAQLWGPLKVEYRDHERRQATSITGRGGCLHQVSSFQNSTLIAPSTDETLCHWVSWLDVEDLATLDNAVSIDITKRLLIGAYATDESRRKRRYIPSMQLSDNCQCRERYSFNYDAFELRTRLPSWKLDARTVQVTGGQYVTVNMGCTYKFDAGWTLKDVIVETWLGSDTTEPDPRFSYLNPRYLDYLVVLDISCCSGNARRISLWKLLNHISVRGFLRRNLNKGFFQDLERTLETLSSVESIADTWLQLSPSAKDLLTPALKFVLTMLKFTGIRENKLLQVWDMTEVERVDGRKINPRWISMLEDNDRCATFAIMTGTCVEYPSSIPRDIKGKTHRETVLCTQLCIATRATIQGRTLPETEQEKKQTSGAESSQNDGLGKFSSKWAVPSSSGLDTSGSVQPPRDKQSHVEKELLERLRRRQSSRQAISPKVEMPSESISALPEHPSFKAESPFSTPSHLGGGTRGLEQQEHSVYSTPSTRASKPYNLNVTQLDFINGSGYAIGCLIFNRLYGPKSVVNISRLSNESAVQARWEPYDHSHSLINSIEKTLDKKFGTWAQRSNGFIPRMFNRFIPQVDPPDVPSATEHIRLGSLKDGEMVVRSFIR